MESCEICDRDAAFMCADCQMARYCTMEHRNEHWRTHKEQCKVIKRERERLGEERAHRQRLEIRKRYFEHFNHKIYDQCIVIASELFELERRHMETTKEIFNEFEYGIAVCLLCRTYLMINRPVEAKQEADMYLREKIHFLEDLRNIPSLPEMEDYSCRARQFFEKKLALISAMASIYHELRQNCIRLYQIYASHIELVFGGSSPELSNAYFCVGGYYQELNEANKAIACYVKAASIRGKKGGGDCYVNISLLYRRQGRLPAAIDMMLTAVKLNEEEFGSNSREVGEVFEKLGLLYIDICDFNNAILNLENALKIYINQKESEDYQRIRNKIQTVYSRIRTATEEDTKEKKYRQSQQAGQEDSSKEEVRPIDLDKIFRVSEGFMQRLNSMELFSLSELQLELEQCRSEYAVASAVGSSEFFRQLADTRKKELRIENQKLFALIKL